MDENHSSKVTSRAIPETIPSPLSLSLGAITVKEETVDYDTSPSNHDPLLLLAAQIPLTPRRRPYLRSGRSQTETCVCEVCQGELNRFDALLQHKLLHFNTGHVCYVCDSYFVNVENLLLHMSSVHRDILGAYPKGDAFVCPICVQRFSSSKSLLKHQSIHSPHKDDFTCTICALDLLGCRGLLAHLNSSRHKDMKVKIQSIFICIDCRSVFASRDSYAFHMMMRAQNETCDAQPNESLFDSAINNQKSSPPISASMFTALEAAATAGVKALAQNCDELTRNNFLSPLNLSRTQQGMLEASNGGGDRTRFEDFHAGWNSLVRMEPDLLPTTKENHKKNCHDKYGKSEQHGSEELPSGYQKSWKENSENKYDVTNVQAQQTKLRRDLNPAADKPMYEKKSPSVVTTTDQTPAVSGDRKSAKRPYPVSHHHQPSTICKRSKSAHSSLENSGLEERQHQRERLPEKRCSSVGSISRDARRQIDARGRVSMQNNHGHSCDLSEIYQRKEPEGRNDGHRSPAGAPEEEEEDAGEDFRPNSNKLESEDDVNSTETMSYWKNKLISRAIAENGAERAIGDLLSNSYICMEEAQQRQRNNKLLPAMTLDGLAHLRMPASDIASFNGWGNIVPRNFLLPTSSEMAQSASILAHLGLASRPPPMNSSGTGTAPCGDPSEQSYSMSHMKSTSFGGSSGSNADLHQPSSSSGEVDNNDVISYVTSHKDKLLMCKFCNIIYTDQIVFYLHMGLHNLNNPWQCNLCGKVCANVQQFSSHVIHY